ncbi:MAG: hypothetical protein HWE11_12750 [Gammaproteobacteria bacterium]|nr:hypothetical protein [Gammaproteobacteria bacterium]
MNTLSKVFLLGSLSVASTLVFANDYLPMTAEDSKSFSNNLNTEVVETYGRGWKKYTTYMGRSNQWVWSSDSSSQVFWFNDNGETELLVDFNAPVGTQYNVAIDDCTTAATIADKDYSVSTTAGQFNGAVQLTFNGQCPDAGLAEAVFAPGVGLVAYAYQSIAGPVMVELTQAKVAGVTFPMFHGISVTSEMPSGRILTNQQDSVAAYLTLENHSNSVETFQFNSGQTFDIEILDVNGNRVNLWSANKRFTMALQTIELQPGATHRFGGEIDLVDFAGNTLDVGSYVIRVMITGSNHPQASAFSPVQYVVSAPLYIDNISTTR